MAVLSVLAVLATAQVAAGPSPPKSLIDATPPPIPADGYLEVASKVTDHVHLIASPAGFHVQPIGNVTVIEQSDGLVLVDSGGSPGSGRRIADMVRAISPKPVKAIIITHWHSDHPYGLQALLEIWPGAKVISTRKTRDALIDGPGKEVPTRPDAARAASMASEIETALADFASKASSSVTAEERAGYAASVREIAQFGRDLRDVRTVEPNTLFTDRLDLPDAVAPVQVMFLGRANTEGDAVVWLPKQKVLASGDVVVAPIPFGFGSHPAEWIGVLRRLKAYPYVALVPGHGPVQRDRAYLDRLITLIGIVRARVGPLTRDGMSYRTVREKVSLEDQARVFVGDDPWMRLWFTDSWTVPMVRAAWSEARAESARSRS